MPTNNSRSCRTSSVNAAGVTIATKANKKHALVVRRTSDQYDLFAAASKSLHSRRSTFSDLTELGNTRRLQSLSGKFNPDQIIWEKGLASCHGAPERTSLLKKFKLAAKLIIILSRIAKSHTLRNNIYDVIAPHIKGLHFRDYETKVTDTDLVFDPSKFKADKRLRVGEETKRILTTPPSQRTEKDLYYAQIALRNIHVYAEYPVRMQKSIVKVATYERFEGKRVIVRQGQPAQAFYIILSGSVVVMVCDEETKVPRPTAYLHRGKAFGELAIINRTTRQSTVIAKETVELLTIDIEDFHRIFMAGGIKNINDRDHCQFIRNISFLRDWPLKKMAENPNRCMFHYFRRGDVLVKDSNYSDWIYIVKSGSLRVLKKLKSVRPFQWRKTNRRTPSTEKSLRYPSSTTSVILSDINIPLRTDNNVSSGNQSSALAGEIHVDNNRSSARLSLTWTRNIRRRTTQSLPSLPIPASKFRSSSRRQLISTSTHCFGANSLDSLVSARSPQDGATVRRRLHCPKRGRVKRGQQCTMTTSSDDIEVEEEMEGRKQQIRTIMDDINAAFKDKTSQVTDIDLHPQFVQIQTLTKGQSFGLVEVLFSNQPSLCVVSNGSECIMLHKSLYLEYASDALLRRVEKESSPYPSDDELQKQLQIRVDWEAYRQIALAEVLKSIESKRAVRVQTNLTTTSRAYRHVGVSQT